MINAKQELLEHIGNREVKYAYLVIYDRANWVTTERLTVKGALSAVIDSLDFDYSTITYFGNVSGVIWYEDGSWSEREFDGYKSYWDHKEKPSIEEYRNRED